METVAVVARMILVGVFGVSGIAKILDRQGSLRAVEAFGVPKAFVRPVAVGLPVAECVVAIALVPGTSARAAALAGILLLTAFTAGISVNLARGRRPDCGCFGELHSTPLGRSTLVRNGALLSIASVAAFASGADAGGAVADLDPWGRVLAGAVVAGVVASIVILARQSGGHDVEEAEELPGLDIGSEAPPFSLPDIAGRSMTLDDLLARGNKVLLVFVSMHCGPCVKLAPELARWQRELPGRLTIAVISSGNIESVRAEATEYGFAELLIDESRDVATMYGGRATPSAVLIARDGTVASQTKAGQGPIGSLLLEAFGLSEVLASLKDRDDANHAHAGHDDDNAEPETVLDADLFDIEAIDGSFVPIARDNVAMADHAGDTVVVDRATGVVHVLNPSAAIVWRCLDGSGSVAEIAADIADVFGTDPAEVVDATIEVVTNFARQGLLAGVRTETSSVPAST